MDSAVTHLRSLPEQVSRAGGSLPWRLALLGLMLLVNIGFYLPVLPEGMPGGSLPGLDKLVHLIVFALTVWAAGRLLAPHGRFPMGWVVILALIHAAAIELIQLALPQRSGELLDLLADLLGIAIGVALWAGERVLRRAEAHRDPEPRVVARKESLPVTDEPLSPAEGARIPRSGDPHPHDPR